MEFNSAVVAIIAPLVLLTLTSCDKDDRKAEVDRFALELGAKRVADLDRHLQVFEARALKLDQAHFELAKREAHLAKLEDRIAPMVEEIAVLEGTIGSQKQAHLAYVKHAREENRLAARGETMAELEVPSGRIYRDLKITRVTDVGLEIKHSLGAARVAFRDVPKDLQTRFLFDPEISKQVLQDEKARANRYASLVDMAVVKKRVADALAAEDRIERESKVRLAQFAYASKVAVARLSSSSSGFGSSPSRLGSSTSSRIRVNSRYSRSSRYNRPRTIYYYNNSRPTVRPSVNRTTTLPPRASVARRPAYAGCPAN